MSYVETGEEIVLFTEREDELIQNWLKENGFSWKHNTVCGNCCGMYEDEYWVNGIGGSFPKEKREKFVKFAQDEKIDCEVERYTIRAVKD